MNEVPARLGLLYVSPAETGALLLQTVMYIKMEKKITGRCADYQLIRCAWRDGERSVVFVLLTSEAFREKHPAFGRLACEAFWLGGFRLQGCQVTLPDSHHTPHLLW
jgi:hypothetical protein